MRTPHTVLWHYPGVLQISNGSDRPLLIADSPPQGDEVVRLLLAGRGVFEIQSRHPAVSLTWIDRVASHLAAAKLPHSLQSPRTWHVLLHGNSSVASTCDSLLRSLGVTVHHSDETDPLPPQVPVGTSAILATNRIEPDRNVATELTQRGIPHIVVRSEPERTVVGPFVHVGHSPCQRCLDLVRRDLDHRWPYALAQLCRMVIEPDAAHTGWAAATTVAQVRAWHHQATPDTLGATIELEHHSQTLRSRRWQRHPACACNQPASERSRA
ncbi:MAG: hypothetical protein ACK5LN_14385 [Propioniciclava sp.]